jgi:hypothetical protein
MVWRAIWSQAATGRAMKLRVQHLCQQHCWWGCAEAWGFQGLGLRLRDFVITLDWSHERRGPSARVGGPTLCLWVFRCLEQVAAASHHRLKGSAHWSYLQAAAGVTHCLRSAGMGRLLVFCMKSLICDSCRHLTSG